MLGLTLLGLLALDAPPTDAEFERGRGWYSAGAAIPEPPVALALVIVAAAGMRLRERRRLGRPASAASTSAAS